MKKAILLIILLVIPLVSAESYRLYTSCYPNEIGFGEMDCKDYYLEVYNKNPDIIYNNCWEIFRNVTFESFVGIRKIRVWDNNPKEGQPAGLYFLSNIIHIYDGCRNPDTLIHELAHLDRKSIKHDSFFWLSYYRIKMV